jgi:excisionase family DNA binding protein
MANACAPFGLAHQSRTGSAPTSDLTRLVRLIARQAAQEALKTFRDGLTSPASHPEAIADPQFPPPEREERWLSVGAVAERLGVSEKWVRRKIGTGELPAHRVGRLLRIGERDLAEYVALKHLGREENDKHL